jgi:hypothetical protein
MNTKHTPGPWRFSTGIHGNAIEAFSGRSYGEGDDGFRVVATYQECEPTDIYRNRVENAKANGHLIAAAPDMFAALEDCREALRRAGADGELRVVDAAIAKARGGA